MPRDVKVCQVEDCELCHCRQCGGHTDDPMRPCDGCYVEQVQQTTEAITKAYKGNYEQAALDQGW